MDRDDTRRLSRWLRTAPGSVFAAYAMVVSFATYFCMYAFRKPFAAATFEGQEFGFLGIDLKTGLVISQIIGYALSKYVGIKVCSETRRDRRAWLLCVLIVWAELALVLFAVLPPGWNALALFLNGLPLGMIWGLVVLYLEGRRTSELLLAGLSCSFIVSSGVVKDVGRDFLAIGVSESWMPALTGLCFLLPFFVSVWLLNQIPRPDELDVEARTERAPMSAAERFAFARRFFFGCAALLVVYFFLTAYRDFRDNYAVEILAELGYREDPALLTKTELPVAFGVLVALGALVMVRDNRRGLLGAYAIMICGTVLLGVSTLLLDAGAIDGLWWMILVGLGGYLAYVPFGSVLFDRLIASTRSVGTAVFAIYVMDAVGYTGSVGMQLYKDLGHGEASRAEFFHAFTYGMAVVGTVGLVGSCVYFVMFKSRRE